MPDARERTQNAMLGQKPRFIQMGNHIRPMILSYNRISSNTKEERRRQPSWPGCGVGLSEVVFTGV